MIPPPEPDGEAEPTRSDIELLVLTFEVIDPLNSVHCQFPSNRMESEVVSPAVKVTVQDANAVSAEITSPTKAKTIIANKPADFLIRGILGVAIYQTLLTKSLTVDYYFQ